MIDNNRSLTVMRLGEIAAKIATSAWVEEHDDTGQLEEPSAIERDRIGREVFAALVRAFNDGIDTGVARGGDARIDFPDSP